MPPDEASGRQRQTRQAGGAKAAKDASSPRSAGAGRGAPAKAGAQARSPTRRAAAGGRAVGAAKGVSKAATGSARSGAGRAAPAGRTARAAAKAGPDAVAFLKQDHRTVDGLFRQFEEASDGRTRSSLMRKIAQALMVHTQIEEEIFYPLAREELGDHDLLNEAQVEHDSLRRLIGEIEATRPSDLLYKARVAVLKEYVKHHVKEEERQLFPLVKQAGLDLEAMGEELAARHRELMRGGGAGRGRGRRAGAQAGMQLRG